LLFGWAAVAGRDSWCARKGSGRVRLRALREEQPVTFSQRAHRFEPLGAQRGFGTALPSVVRVDRPRREQGTEPAARRGLDDETASPHPQYLSRALQGAHPLVRSHGADELRNDDDIEPPLRERRCPERGDLHIDEHAAAVNRMHTGRPTSGTVVYPSIGSVVAHKLGKPAEAIPPYVLMGYPNLTRGPGFLGAKHGFIYLTDTETGPAGLQRNPSISALRQGRREALLGRLRKSYLERRRGDAAVRDYSDAGIAGLRLAGPEFMGAFALDKEPASLRESYGSEFGQRCLLARRLVERGVRFIEVAHNLNFINGTGWDTHNEGQRNQHILIRELDKAFSTLVTDLEKRSMLEKTLILISTEFGRPPGFDGRGGRGHQSKTFSLVLAGGGLKSGQVVGQSDELGQKILSDPVSIPDLFATVYNAVGIDPAGDLYAANRPVPLTDQGKPLGKLFT